MDETKKKMIDSVKKQIDKNFEKTEGYVDIDIINIYNDASGLSGLKHMRCGCCSEPIFDDTMRENIQEHFTKDDQLEVANHFVHLLMNKYGMNKYERMSKETLAMLRHLVNYILESEQKHWEESDRPEVHPYKSAMWVAEYLEQ